MSNTLAIELPASSPRAAEVPQRHIEIVSSRNQKRARPRVIYALVAVGGLFLILMTQLLLSIFLSNGAYQIAGLQTSQRDLGRDQQVLTESLNVLRSPQNLAARAAQLGMVTNTGSQGFLSLTHGVTRAPTAATTDTSVTPDDSALTPNALITPEMAALGASVSDPGSAPVSGAPADAAATGSVPSSPTALPSPITQ